jgi:hypothetical protein
VARSGVQAAARLAVPVFTTTAGTPVGPRNDYREFKQHLPQPVRQLAHRIAPAGPPTRFAASWLRRDLFAGGIVPVLLEFDADRVVAVLVDVLDRMRALRLQPVHAHAGRVPARRVSNCTAPPA